jgi:hypothetical protein
MRYTPVKRVVTVEFVEDSKSGGYDIRLEPEQVVARYRDTIVWDVQGLPAGLAKQVAFGAFLPIEVPSRIADRNRSLVPLKPRLLPRESVAVKEVGARFQAAVNLDRTDPGLYKYSVECGGRTLRDPEIEIRGPRI